MPGCSEHSNGVSPSGTVNVAFATSPDGIGPVLRSSVSIVKSWVPLPSLWISTWTSCPGVDCARLEAVPLLATIARRWRFELDPTDAAEPQPVITLRPRTGVNVTAVVRDR
jgi:hypothetical protein